MKLKIRHYTMRLYINLQLDSRAVRYIMTNNKKIDVRGPMFVHVEFQLGPNEDEQNNKESEQNDALKKD